MADYQSSGVRMLPADIDTHETQTTDEYFWKQYVTSITPERVDIELFALMSFAYLGISYEDAPPSPLDSPNTWDRYHISYGGLRAAVFCLECDGLFDAAIFKAMALQSSTLKAPSNANYSVLCIINHQKQKTIEHREVQQAISDDACLIAGQSQITFITALDLCALVQGVAEHKWDIEPIRKLLFTCGRQGQIPPGYRKIGTYTHFYSRHSVMEVELQQGETIRYGDTFAIRRVEHYHEEVVESLQVQRNAVPLAIGPCRVGIEIKLLRSDLRIGQDVFLRTA